MNKKQNIIFYDEQLYRFSHYYEDEGWWSKNGFNAFKQSLQSNIFKLVFQLQQLKPKFVIFVQRSNRVFFLAYCANLLGIKVIFWQHGIFAYPAQIKFPFNCLNPQIDHLLYLSDYDKEKLINDFRNVKDLHEIKHYDVPNILKNKSDETKQTKILYIGQIIFKEQLLCSESNPWIDRNIKHSSPGPQKLLESVFDYIKKNEKFKLFIKKHPGDKSDFIDQQIERFNSTLLDSRESILPDLVIGHFSTLIVAYMEIGIPVILLPHGLKLDAELDLSHYGKHYQCSTLNEFINCAEKIKKNKKIKSFKCKSISETLLDIID